MASPALPSNTKRAGASRSPMPRLNLVADLQHVLRLHRRIVTDLVIGDVTGMLGAQVHLDLGIADAGDDALDLISCI